VRQHRDPLLGGRVAAVVDGLALHGFDHLRPLRDEADPARRGGDELGIRRVEVVGLLRGGHHQERVHLVGLERLRERVGRVRQRALEVRAGNGEELLEREQEAVAVGAVARDVRLARGRDDSAWAAPRA
jgi:hypothetical protein